MIVASWILIPCLQSLRNEFNELAPNRDKASDGSIGDPAHAASSSDHNPDETGRTPYEDSDSINEVHAIDVDDDLRLPGVTMQSRVNLIVERHRTGKDDRLQNVIYNRVIWSRTWGWTPRAYTGASPHTEHAHFSARYTTAQEKDTRPWGILEEPPLDAKFEYFNAHLPVIPYGHDDARGIKGSDGRVDKTGYVRRIQTMLDMLLPGEVTIDGDYGKQTKAAVAALKVPGNDGSKVDMAVWIKLFALWGAHVTATK